MGAADRCMICELYSECPVCESCGLALTQQGALMDSKEIERVYQMIKEDSGLQPDKGESVGQFICRAYEHIRWTINRSKED